MLAKVETQKTSTFQQEMYQVLSNRKCSDSAFTVPKGLSERELLQLMRKRRSQDITNG